MSQPYSQLTAMLAITKASLKAVFRSPQAIFFSLFFPVVLIWIFGSLRGNGTPSVPVALEKGIDSSNKLYAILRHNPVLHFVDDKNKNIEDDLNKGRIAAVINILSNRDSAIHSPFIIHLRTSPAGQKDFALLRSALGSTIASLDSTLYPQQQSVATIQQTMTEGGRRYRMIDFFLPGEVRR